MRTSNSFILTCALALAAVPALAAGTSDPSRLTNAAFGSRGSGGGGADDPAGDDRGGQQGGHGADDPAGDDRGGQQGGHGADDPAGDDHGGQQGGGNNPGNPAPVNRKAGVFKFGSRGFQVAEGAGVARITVERSRGQRGAATVVATAVAGTAAAGNDFEPVSVTLSWAAGEGGSKSFEIPVLDDSLSEGNETVQLALTTPTGGAGLDARRGKAVLKVLDNDGKTACVPDGKTLCVTGGRFAVEVAWLAPGGGLRAGLASPLSSTSGAFRLADPEGADLLVKVVDECAATGAFRVFLAPTTATAFSVSVTDTRTGLVKQYDRVEGELAQAVEDAATFACN